jgi:hypothetical protein
MHPNMATRLALTAAIAGTLFLCAYRCKCQHTVVAPTPIAAEAAYAPLMPPAPPAPSTQPVFGTADTEDKVRQAARDYIKESVPNSKMDGVFLLPFVVDNLYIAGVDTTTSGGSGTSRSTYDLLVRLYVRKNGSSYWRAERIGHEEAVSLRQRALAQ